jgi:hypothetical protein
MMTLIEVLIMMMELDGDVDSGIIVMELDDDVD